MHAQDDVNIQLETAVKSQLQRIAAQLQRCDNSSHEQERKYINSIIELLGVYLKKTQRSRSEWLDSLKSIRSKILASRRRVQDAYGNRVDAASLLTQLTDVCLEMDVFISSHFFESRNNANVEPVDYQYEVSLYNSINSIGRETCKDFNDFLEQINIAAIRCPISSPNIFISHAWGIKEDPCKEPWLDDFVERLVRDLKSVSVIVDYDKHNSGAGISRKAFMNEKIDAVNHVVVICCRTMKYKFDNKDTGVTFEYLRYTENNEIKAKDARYIIPLCLNKKGNAPGLVGGIAEVSVYHSSYIEAFLELLEATYNFGSEFWKQLARDLEGTSNLLDYLRFLPTKVRPVIAIKNVAVLNPADAAVSTLSPPASRSPSSSPQFFNRSAQLPVHQHNANRTHETHRNHIGVDVDSGVSLQEAVEHTGNVHDAIGSLGRGMAGVMSGDNGEIVKKAFDNVHNSYANAIEQDNALQAKLLKEGTVSSVKQGSELTMLKITLFKPKAGVKKPDDERERNQSTNGASQRIDDTKANTVPLPKGI